MPDYRGVARSSRITGQKNGVRNGPLGGTGLRSIYGQTMTLPDTLRIYAALRVDATTLNRRDRRLAAKFGAPTS
jgi:hypothetical protein